MALPANANLRIMLWNKLTDLILPGAVTPEMMFAAFDSNALPDISSLDLPEDIVEEAEAKVLL
jgi:hypothetical protein